MLHKASSSMKNIKNNKPNFLTIDYEVVDNEFKRADEIRLPVSVITKLIK